MFAGIVHCHDWFPEGIFVLQGPQNRKTVLVVKGYFRMIASHGILSCQIQKKNQKTYSIPSETKTNKLVVCNVVQRQRVGQHNPAKAKEFFDQVIKAIFDNQHESPKQSEIWVTPPVKKTVGSSH